MPKKPQPIEERLPTYAELADLVCELVETNISNLDGHLGVTPGPYAFVTCFTFSGGEAPDHWHRAIAVREALIASKLATRQVRKYNKSLVRSMRPKVKRSA